LQKYPNKYKSFLKYFNKNLMGWVWEGALSLPSGVWGKAPISAQKVKSKTLGGLAAPQTPTYMDPPRIARKNLF
jgi:hypothetical protein